MDVLIVDDEPLARKRLNKLAGELGFEPILEAENAAEAWELIQQQDPAIVLLDIEMPGENGLDLAKRLMQLEVPPAVIFTTAYDEYALEAFGTIACGYLLKPVQKQKLFDALEQAAKSNKLNHHPLDEAPTQKQRTHFTAKDHRGIHLIDLDDVYVLKADQKYIQVISKNGSFLIEDSLRNLEAEFSDRFIRIHRNALVAVKDIAGMERDSNGQFTIKLLSSDERPMVSRRFTAKVKAQISQI